MSENQGGPLQFPFLPPGDFPSPIIPSFARQSYLSAMTSTLNQRQLLFCQHLASGMSQARAFLAAGYGASPARAAFCAWRLLRNPAVSAHLQTLKEAGAQAAIADRQEVLKELTRAMRASACTLGEADPLTQQVTREETVMPDGTTVIRTRCRMVSKLRAVRQLAVMLGVTTGEPEPPARSLPSAESSAPTSPPDVSSLNMRQRLFCENLAKGMSHIDACKAAGYAVSQKDSVCGSQKLLSLPAIRAFIQQLAAPVADPAVADRQEILSFLTRAIRVPLDSLEEGDPVIEQLVRETEIRRDGSTLTRTRLRSVCRLGAMRLLLLVTPPEKRPRTWHCWRAPGEPPEGPLPTPEQRERAAAQAALLMSQAGRTL